MRGLQFDRLDLPSMRHNLKLIARSALLALGADGGQTLNGGTASGDDLIVYSNTSNDGQVRIGGTTLVVDEGASQVAVGTATPDASAALEVSSVTGFVLLPRMTAAQRDAISSPANGSMLYNSDTSKVQARAGGAWVDLH